MNKLLIIIGAALLSALASYGMGYSAGHDARDTLAHEELKATQKAAALALRARISQNKAEQKKAATLIAKLRSRPPKIKRVEIENAIEKSECKRLGDDFVGLFERIHATP